MRTLVIHPYDPTTRFLGRAYQYIDANVLSSYVDRRRLSHLMERADRIMMMGHGSQRGLFSPSVRAKSPYIIDTRLADQLRERDNNIFIWCYASDFVRRHRLGGFTTGMFISEPNEAFWLGVNATDADIFESNYVFADVVGRFVAQPLRLMQAAVNHEYGRLARTNPVAQYNLSRMALTSSTPVPAYHPALYNFAARA